MGIFDKSIDQETLVSKYLEYQKSQEDQLEMKSEIHEKDTKIHELQQEEMVIKRRPRHERR